MRHVRSLLALLVVFVSLLGATRSAYAQTAGEALLPRELDALGDWIAAHKQVQCADHCYVLDRLRLGGSVGDGTAGTAAEQKTAVDKGDQALTFELEGSVLADRAVAVPLFGAPNHVRLDGVVEVTQGAAGSAETTRAASIGFEGDHYYLYTASKHFILRGTIRLQGELALTITGPLNTLEANLRSGRLIEGTRMSGLAGTTLHFAPAETEGVPAPPVVEPTVFQLSRAIRVQRETSFEYRLVMRSGTDLGVVTLPMPNGEKVVDVSGATGWHVEGTSLVLPTSGHAAEITITGTLPTPNGDSGTPFVADARSPYEWWLLETDAEHRLTVTGDAKQLDSSESPIARTQPTARLFLMNKGQSMSVTVQSLIGLESLAAVVREHDRMLVVTPRGEGVVDDLLFYDNSGIDYLLFTPDGKPIYLDTDGASQRLMHKDGSVGELMIPMQKGQHTARVQTLLDGGLSTFGGKLTFPSPSYPLTASREQYTVGLPENVHPIAVLGGDAPQWFFTITDGMAVAVAFVFAFVMLGRRLHRVLGGFAMVGLYCFSPTAFVALIATTAVGWVVFAIARMLRGQKMTTGRWVMVGGGVAFTLAIVAMGLPGRRNDAPSETGSVAQYRSSSNMVDEPVASAPAATAGDDLAKKAADLKEKDKDLAGALGQRRNDPATTPTGNFATGGELEGVRPVALPTPTFARSITVTRELVTRDRPLRPTLVYITDAALLPLVALWIACLALLAFGHRAQAVALRDRLRAWMTPATPQLVAAPVEAPPPVT